MKISVVPVTLAHMSSREAREKKKKKKRKKKKKKEKKSPLPLSNEKSDRKALLR
jgi:hypothetical protein